MGLQLEFHTIGGVIEEREMQRETLPTTRSSECPWNGVERPLDL